MCKTVSLWLLRILAIFIAVAPDLSAAQTVVDTGEVIDLRWTATGSPYQILDGNITIPEGAILTIERGVRVEIGSGLRIIVQGELAVRGSKADPVLFTAADEGGAWMSLQFEAQSYGVIRHAHIERAFALQSRASLLTIEDTVFRDNASDIVVLKGRVEVRRSRFEGSSTGGVLCSTDGSLSLVNSIIVDKTADAVNLQLGSNSEPSEIINCTLVRNGLGGAPQDGAIHLQVYDPAAPPPLIRNTIITGGKIGIMVDGNGAEESGVFPDFAYSNVWNNVEDYGGTVAIGPAVISSDPMLLSANDLRLQPGSPSIDSGESNSLAPTDLLGIRRPSGLGWDMGAYERPSVCGDGSVDPGEECDDGNVSNRDACSNTCRLPICQDGFVNAPEEECDDGNQRDTDGCDNQCKLRVTERAGQTAKHSSGCAIGRSRAEGSMTLALLVLILGGLWRYKDRWRASLLQPD